MQNCQKCAAACDPADLRELAGRRLCEDCYIDAIELSKTCDPWAVHSAKNTVASQGLPQLTPSQERLYELIQAEKELGFPEAAARLGVDETELRRDFTALRHMELLRGAPRPGGPVIILF